MTGAIFPGFPAVKNLKWRRVPGKPLPGMEPLSETFESRFEGLLAMRSWSPGHGWHLSLSRPDRHPSWEEIRDARYDLLPDECTVGLLLPPKAEYVNLHPHCFHLHEVAGDRP